MALCRVAPTREPLGIGGILGVEAFPLGLRHAGPLTEHRPGFVEALANLLFLDGLGGRLGCFLREGAR